ncbi:MAG TPA: asparagine synthase (glutamine-hydrolyzing) [Gammaproteobacteria bacterium]|nr:asparagine synthase (glutamine-hydrolyzing) [Gammaproteobacteria bacterium]
MCGIAGIVNLKAGRKPEQKSLECMIHQLQHRGPDDYGFYLDAQAGLAHARLSIIDINGGHQPIHDDSSNIWTVFNGEIFNYIELREELIQDGVKFYTQTDTEVIVHLYKKYGLDFANKLNGQFAIALWDTNSSRLLLIRDRVGIAPLFYYKEGQRLFFASEIKSIIPCMKNSPVLNSHGLDQLLSFWSPVSPDTLFENVFEVRPGEMTIIENGDIKHQRYWDWEYPAHDKSHYLQGNEDDLAEELHGRMVDATKIRLRSDVPVGAYLSGGLDSSALVSIMHHHGNVDLRTFSIGFEDKKLDESGYQQQLIQHLGAQHSSLVCSSRDISDNFRKTIWHTESTILRTAPTPMMLLSSLVHKNNYKVVLTGEGADEVFGGYDIFKEGKIRQFWAKNRSSQLRPLLLKRLYPYLDITRSNSSAYLEAFFGIGLEHPDVPGFAHLPRWQTTSRAKAFYSEDMKARLKENALDRMSALYHRDISAWHPFNRSQFIEARSLMAGYLLSSQGDRMLMANSVEGRFPFLDHNVIEFANSLHPDLKMKVLNEKYLLKQAMKRYLPDEIVNRHKQPYRAPDIPAFFHQHKPGYVDELLSEKMIKDYGYFDARKVSIMQRKIKAGKATGYKDNMSFMAILSTQMWHYLFVENFTTYIQ